MKLAVIPALTPAIIPTVTPFVIPTVTPDLIRGRGFGVREPGSVTRPWREPISHGPHPPRIIGMAGRHRRFLPIRT